MAIQLKVRQLCWQANHKKILHNICFDVSQGEVIGIIGPNGAGKTSLLRCLTNQIKKTQHSQLSGSIFLKNKALHHYNAKQIAQCFALVAQKTAPIFSLTVADIVKMGLIPHRNLFSIHSDHDKEQVQLALHKVGLGHASHQIFDKLSGGEQQRVLIARALVQKAQILILDEPTNHLDVYYQHHILQLVKQLKITVIMTVHDINLASQYCQRLLLMHQGQLVCDGSPTDVLTEQQLSQVFNLPCLLEKDPITHHPRVYFSLAHPNQRKHIKGDFNA
ncbi:MAG: ABC transporter ATP-binding protein [Litorilituus sp.]|jgi:iron complex transport system ATP-binding protein|nr:ABC transporter ATP-binding protein [Litorilituus sp.]